MSDSTTVAKKAPLGELLVQTGRITRAELDAALAFRQEHGLKLGHALVALHLVTQAELEEALRSQGTIHCVVLHPDVVDAQVAMELGATRSRQLQAIAINRIAGVVTVAMEDPTETYDVDALSVALGAPVFAVHAEPERIRDCIDHVFGPEPLERPSPTAPAVASAEPVEDAAAASARTLASVFEHAIAIHASDVHLEARRDGVAVRARVDGELYEQNVLPRTWLEPAIALAKSWARLDASERRMPQEGKGTVDVRGRTIEVRVATAPTAHGESAVIRVLDRGHRGIDLAELPLADAQRSALERMTIGGGLVLAAGPSGQGRTTTLHALLRRLDPRQRKIVAVEDPVEDPLDGVVQMHVDAAFGLSLACAARSALHQDPDVLLLGDMRDLETADVAMHAALAGKLVLSTLHAPGAAEAVTRLADLGIEPYVIADALRGVVAQRLVRRLCVECRDEAPATREHAVRLGLADASARYGTARGCERCRYSGYQGRIALYEVLPADAALWDAIRSSQSAQTLREVARANGFASLREDGIAKARAGETTLDDVYAATVRG